MSAQAITGTIVNIAKNNPQPPMPGAPGASVASTSAKPFVANLQLDNPVNAMGQGLGIAIDLVDIDTYLPGSVVTLTPTVSAAR